ncbi:hypothetical protein SAMN02910357_02627, partial [Succinivibrio dextrinosolvens]|uniref:DDE-type integrase/transposase/recombinase n=1 Tax=Succinivibrio dextrinosolvens TaxID=83771 RepID=UPI0008EF0F09
TRSIRMHHELKNKGFRVSHRSLVSKGIYHKYHRKYIKTTDSNHNLARAEDLVKRQFDSFKVNEARCGDITYIPTEGGWLYLASVVDLGSRCLVDYKFGPTMDTNLIFDSLMMAIGDENPSFGTIFHYAQGSLYCTCLFH